MRNEINKYIKRNWKNTVHLPEELSGKVKIDYPYIAPSISGPFTDMYYWDQYFTNIGLLIDGLSNQAYYNLKNIAKFIDELGFMPNANTITDRSQPPFFTLGVYDYYVFKNDVRVIEEFMPQMLKEYEFWQTKRMGYYGLNSYGTHGTAEEIAENYKWLHERVHESSDIKEEQDVIARDIMAIAEMGLDFNMRFKTENSKIAAHEFIHLDLNCILFAVENKISEMLSLIGEEAESEKFLRAAANRKRLINEYLYDKTRGIYLDYNVVRNRFSSVLSAVSLYPYAFGISEDGNGASAVLKRLELEYGVSAGEYRGKDVYFQWDYPCMWPYTTYIVYRALINVGLNNDADRIAEKYIAAVERNFYETGRIWEKYDASNGQVAKTSEYDTPEMMGWSAAIYRFFVEREKALKIFRVW